MGVRDSEYEAYAEQETRHRHDIATAEHALDFAIGVLDVATCLRYMANALDRPRTVTTTDEEPF